MATEQGNTTKLVSQSMKLDASPITVVVGSSEHRFFIHSTVLERTSEFFRAALKPEWIEGQQREVKLPEEDAEAFGTYAEWLYTGKLQTLEHPKLATLYVLGERLIDATFQDTIINAMVAKSRQRDDKNQRWFPGPAIVWIIYRATSSGSPLRRLMVNSYITHGTPEWMTGVHETFAMDVAMAFLHAKKDSQYDKEARTQIDHGVPCAYHKHGKEVVCKSDVMAKFMKD